MKILKEYLFELIIIAPATLFLLGFFILILFYLIGVSFFPQGDFTLSVYSAIFEDQEFKRIVLRTIIFVFIGTPLELILSIIFAILLFNKGILSSIARSLYIVPFAIPTIVTAIVLFVLFDYPGGHINVLLQGKYFIFPFKIISEPINWRSSEFLSLFVSMLGKLWRDLPISTFIILTGLSNIYKEEIDSAKVLGAGDFQILKHIVIPELIPSIFTVLFLRSIEFWKEFIFPFILAPRYYLISTVIENYYHNWNMVDKASAVSLILLGFIVITIILIRFSMNLLRFFTFRLVKNYEIKN